MKRRLDTNILLDVLLLRRPHYAASEQVCAAVETGRVQGMLAAHAVTTIFYLLRKELGNVRARHTITRLLQIFKVAGIDEKVIRGALLIDTPASEDAVAAAAAGQAERDFVVSRDPRGFRHSKLRVLAAEAVVAMLKAL